MASNPTPEDDDVLIALAEDIADGCHLHEVAIGIKQQTEAVMRATIAATNSALLAVGDTKVIRDDKEQLVTTRDTEGKAVLKNCRRRFTKLFGDSYNASWQAAGFPNGSTAVPTDEDQRFTLLNALKVYFAAHPEAESADFEATAALCAAAHTALSDARQQLNTAQADFTSAEDVTLPAALKTLRKRVRGLINELGTLIADDDPRWEAFGLNIPAHASAPEPIEDLTLTALGSGKVLAQWPYATRMTGTRIMLKRIGVDDEPGSAGTSGGLEKVINGQTPGQTVEVFVIAYNDGGDAPPSPTRSIPVV